MSISVEKPKEYHHVTKVELYNTASRETSNESMQRVFWEWVGMAEYLNPLAWWNRFQTIKQIQGVKAIEPAMMNLEGTPIERFDILFPNGFIASKIPIIKFRAAYITTSAKIARALTKDQPRVGNRDEDFWQETGFTNIVRMMAGDENVFSSFGDIHKRLRPSLVTYLGSRNVRNFMVPIFARTIKACVDEWTSKEQPVVMNNRVRVLSARAIGAMLGAEPEDFATIEKATDELLNSLTSRRKWTGVGSPAEIREMLMSVLPKENNPFFDALVNHSEGEKVAAAVLMFIAGQETVSSSWNHWIWRLGRDAKLQEEIREEMRTVLKTDDSLTFVEFIKRLTNTRKLIQQEIQSYPPAWTWGRCAKQAVTMDVTTEESTQKYQLHTGDFIMYSPYFAAKKGQEDEVLPFGAGNNLCPGKEFAYIELTVGTAIVLSQCMLSSELQDPNIDTLVAIIIKDDVPVKFEKLDEVITLPAFEENIDD